MRRLVLPEDMKHWTLTSLQTRLIETGGRLVRHARRLVFQLAEVMVTGAMLDGDTGMAQPALAGTWLACVEGTGIYEIPPLLAERVSSRQGRHCISMT